MNLKTLEDAARQCGKLVVKMREQGVTATDKDDVRGAHFVTEADVKSQALGIEIVRKSFPDEMIVAEEQENEENLPADFTVMDPIDGTNPYFNGADEFGVTLCTFRDGQPVMGVIYLPVKNILLTCEKGKGVGLNGTQLPAFVWNRPLDKTILGMDIGPWTSMTILKNLAEAGFTFRSSLAAVYSAFDLIAGHTGAYVHSGGAKIWDAAAGSLMVQELGGLTLNPDGSPIVWDKVHMSWIWAVNQKLAGAVLKYTKDITSGGKHVGRGEL